VRAAVPRGRKLARLWNTPSDGIVLGAMTPTITHLTRELDSRTFDGIEVRLLWSEHDGRVLVAVNDSKTGDSFSLEVHEGERAMDVFHHPYAYAASRTSTR
jgi:hypothetical protein